ncbi:MAG: hypothetical protein R3C32_12235 [Chloroflexota bacterium]
MTSALVPDGIDWGVFSRELRSRGLVVAGAQGALAGRVFRIGHSKEAVHASMTSCAALETIEAGSLAMGILVRRGACGRGERPTIVVGRSLASSGAPAWSCPRRRAGRRPELPTAPSEAPA